MDAKKLLIIFVLIFTLSGCDIIPTDFNFDANIQTTSELGQDTLDRVDAVNETLATGLEVGPETRDTIEELNQTIANGIKGGFDEETLARVDELLRVVEDGLKIGLDSETLDSLNSITDTIDQMPGQWETSASEIIRTLDSSAGSTAKKMANEIKGVMDEATINYQQMTAVTGTEFRCNVDYLGSKAGSSVQEFIGKSLVGKIKQILSSKDAIEEKIPIPWVCQIIPNSLGLTQAGEKLVFEEGIVSLTGYNFVQENTPRAVILDENGNEQGGVSLQVYRTSPYQLQVNLQDLDLSMVPARSRLVFIWPNVSETSGIAVLLPGHEVPVANFEASPSSGQAPLSVQFSDKSLNDPVQWEWSFGDGDTSLDQNPMHTFQGDGSFNVRLTASNARGSTEVIQTISVGVPLSADFTFSSDSNDAPRVVTFEDKSKGSPTAWAWDFGDDTNPSTEQNPVHVYTNTNPSGYVVSLTVTNSSGSSTKTSTDHIKVLPAIIANFTSNVKNGKPPLTVKFTDQSTGEVVGWKWDFGDDSGSLIQNPIHTYDKTGQYTVTLTVFRSDGKSDKKTDNGMITVRYLLRPLVKNLWTFPEKSVFFTNYTLNSAWEQIDTGIPANKYVCAAAGAFFGSGKILPFSGNRDPFGVYLWPTTTWWLTAGYLTDSPQRSVDIVCLDRALEGKAFIFKDNFKNIASGEEVPTGVSTNDAFNCMAGSYLANGPADFPRSGLTHSFVHTNLLQVLPYSEGDEWKVRADIPLSISEKWDLSLLCLKKGQYMLQEYPPFVTGTLEIPAYGSHKANTGISSNDFQCAVGGFSAENGDQGFDLLGFPPVDIAVSFHMIKENGTWWAQADHASVIRDENWTINYWCARKPYAVQGIPPH
jgi:PKD repeat protein